MTDRLNIPHLCNLGYRVLEDNRVVNPDGMVIYDNGANRLEKLNGRLDNVRYMAHAIDQLDHINEMADAIPGGLQQFVYLVQEQPAVALIYVKLRRLQREARTDELLAGAALLTAADIGEISHDMALSLLGPVERVGDFAQTALALLPAPTAQTA